MPVNFLDVSEPSPLVRVQLKAAGDLDKLLGTFDCYTNPSVQGEAVLDVAVLADDEDLTAEAIALFGQDNWDKLPGSLVLFYL